MKRSKIDKFTNDQIRQMFKRRFEGANLAVIAEENVVSTWTVGQILARKARAEVSVPEKHLEAAKKLTRELQKRTTKRSKKANGLVEKALVNYVAACKTLMDSALRCDQAGVGQHTMAALRDAMIHDRDEGKKPRGPTAS